MQVVINQLDLENEELLCLSLAILKIFFEFGDVWSSEKNLPENAVTAEFEKYDGVKKLEKLQHHESQKVYNVVEEIIDQYF